MAEEDVLMQLGDSIYIQIPPQSQRQTKRISGFGPLNALIGAFPEIGEAIQENPYFPIEILYRRENKETRQEIFVAPDMVKKNQIDISHGVWINIPGTQLDLSLAIECPPAVVPQQPMDEALKQNLEEIPQMWTNEMVHLLDLVSVVAAPIVSTATGNPLAPILVPVVTRGARKIIGPRRLPAAETTKADIRQNIKKLLARVWGQTIPNVVGGAIIREKEMMVIGLTLENYPIELALSSDISCLYISGSLSDNARQTCQFLSSKWTSENKNAIITHSPVTGDVIVYSQGKQHRQEMPHNIRGVSTCRFVDLSAFYVSTDREPTGE